MTEPRHLRSCGQPGTGRGGAPARWSTRSRPAPPPVEAKGAAEVEHQRVEAVERRAQAAASERDRLAGQLLRRIKHLAPRAGEVDELRSVLTKETTAPAAPD